jgi:hypothetical protein
VAFNPTFELDQEEDMYALNEMLKYMYGSHDYQTLPTPDYQTPTITDEHLVVRLGYCLRIYTIADKYDCPALRAEVFAEFYHRMWDQAYRLGKLDILFPFIRGICGPEAPFFADGSLWINVAAFCQKQVWDTEEHETFVEMLRNGLMLNVERYIVAEDLAWVWDEDSDSDSDDYDYDYENSYEYRNGYWD